VVLRGVGRSFSAGNRSQRDRAGERAPSPHFQAKTLDALELPAAAGDRSVLGHCYTGALELVLACDLLVSGSPRSSRTPTASGHDADLGHEPAPAGAGSASCARADDVQRPGRDGRSAVALGLANECVPDGELETHTLSPQRARSPPTPGSRCAHTRRCCCRAAGLPPAQALAYERANSPGAGPDMASD